MLPKETTDIVGKQLALIAQNTIYAIQTSSGLNNQKWQAFRTRVVAEGLAKAPFTDQVELTPEGEEVASRSPKGYTRFRRKRARELGDTLLTNLFSRWGAIATIAATLLSLWAVCKPDDTKEKIEALEQAQVLLQLRIDTMSAHQRLLANKQDSLARSATKTVRPVTPLSNASHGSSLSTQVVQGKAASRKHR